MADRKVGRQTSRKIRLADRLEGRQTGGWRRKGRLEGRQEDREVWR